MSQKQHFDTDFALLCEKTVADLTSISTDSEWFEELLGAYEAQTQSHMGALSKAIHDGAKQEGLDLVHTLKSSNLQIGALRMGEVFKYLEGLLESDNFSQAQQMFEHLPDLFQQTLRALRSVYIEGLKS
ncbi:MAG: hypothetical protein CMH56_09800 [Myxococcales bacterium]|nr:hypothetical protein [Myxococcales bacterium]|tara:strand:- start:6267 stop:6653 length:387 start_codon:yes stop_codon:yes gene_type:complete